MSTKEQVSALMDGELDERAAGEAIQQLRQEGDALDTWRLYHLISDGMRDTRLLSAGFTTRLSERLAAEPTVLAPSALPGRTPAHRFAYAAAASVAAVGLVGWLAFGPQPEAPRPLAQAQPATAAVATVPLPSRANDYLLAHQGFSPRVSLQGMAPYVRTVADRADELRDEPGK
jgi:sigma-E factor negative regulatory protein RseA